MRYLNVVFLHRLIFDEEYAVVNHPKKPLSVLYPLTNYVISTPSNHLVTSRKLRQAKSQDDLKASKSHSLLADIKPITVSSDDLQQHTLRQKSVDAEKRRLDIALSAFKDKSKERERDDVV